MIFFIHKSVADAINSRGSSDHNLIVALDQLAYSRRDGEHLLLGEILTLISLSKNTHLSLIARSVYARSSRNSVYEDELLNLVSDVIVVYDGLIPEISEEIFSAKKRFLDISHLTSRILCSKTVLLGENENDANFYKYLGEIYSKSQKNRTLSIRCDLLGGGGNTTWVPYKNYQGDGQRLCLCIVDSDISAPGLSVGETASRVRTNHNPTCPTAHWFYIDARNLECLLPDSWYLSYAASDHTMKSAINHNSQVLEEAGPTVKKYADMKKGIRGKKVMSESDASPYQIYWRDVMRKIASLKNCNDECIDKRSCVGLGSCRCIVIHKMSDDIFEKVWNHILKLEDEKRSSLAIEEWIAIEWHRIGHLVWSWCCGDEGIAT